MRFSIAWIWVIFLLVCPSLVPAMAIEMSSWGVDRIGARCVWDKDMNMSCDPNANAGQYDGQNENVTVAIIDTGVNASHADLSWRDLFHGRYLA